MLSVSWLYHLSSPFSNLSLPPPASTLHSYAAVVSLPLLSPPPFHLQLLSLKTLLLLLLHTPAILLLTTIHPSLSSKPFNAFRNIGLLLDVLLCNAAIQRLELGL